LDFETIGRQILVTTHRGNHDPGALRPDQAWREKKIARPVQCPVANASMSAKSGKNAGLSHSCTEGNRFAPEKNKPLRTPWRRALAAKSSWDSRWG